MSDWYDEPYKGGPMVAVPGFPRPLYPPDAEAKGKTPSADGPDVIAYKRTVCRAGRWGEWDPDSWDDSFSNAFSHGKGTGNVKDSGVAGIQRQQKLDPTGWIGEATFNTLRSIRVPEGPNEGDMAMDAYAVSLIEQAWERFGGKESHVEPRDLALKHMSARLGYTENPSGSNCDDRSDGIRTSQDHCADGTWLRGEPWCGCWCFYALETAGVERIDSHLASVAQIEDYARQAAKCYRGWTNDRARVKAGDLVVIGGRGVHVEMVRSINGDGSTSTYGGNTSPGTSGSQSNGGGAYARVRYSSEVYGYALVRYPGE